MPRLNFTTVLAANVPQNPLTGWQYEYVPWPAKVVICTRSTTANTKQTLSAGSTQLIESSPVPAGGTAGQTPTPFNSPVIEEYAAAGDRLKMTLVDTGAATVDGFVDVQPILG